MNNDLLLLIVGLVCLGIGGFIGWLGTYYWLLHNKGGEGAEEWYL
jgi:hypothetical protein